MDNDYREDEGFIRYQNNLDERSRRNMRRFASFMAKMIDKYGDAVLEKINSSDTEGSTDGKKEG